MSHAKGPQPLIVVTQEVLVPSLGHPHSPCFWCIYGAYGSLASHPLAPCLALLKLICCRTLPSIDANHVPLRDSG